MLDWMSYNRKGELDQQHLLAADSHRTAAPTEESRGAGAAARLEGERLCSAGGGNEEISAAVPQSF